MQAAFHLAHEVRGLSRASLPSNTGKLARYLFGKTRMRLSECIQSNRFPWQEYELALDPQYKERGNHLLTDISDSLRVRGAVVLEGLL